MTKIRLFAFALLISSIFSSNLLASENEEFRAAWVITWEFSNGADDMASSKARIDKVLDNMKNSNMNAVLWQVRQGGSSYYNSSYEPVGSYYPNEDPADYDVFEYAVEQAHARGLEIHAWFNTFSASHTDPGTPAAEHPGWICRDPNNIPMTENIALSPGLDSVRSYTINVAMEIVRNYDIDGLHLDYIRWNEFSSSTLAKTSDSKPTKESLLDRPLTNDQVENLMNSASGRYLYDIEHPFSAGIPDSVLGTPFISWENYWRWSVTEFVKTLHDSVQNVKPWVRLSPAALGKYNWSGWNGYRVVYQDAALWFNEGYIDQFMGMHYHWKTAAGFYGMLKGDCPSCWEQWIGPGIAAGRLYTVGPGSYAFKADWNNHPSVVERIRDVAWVDGTQFFSYGSWDDKDYWETASNTFFTNKTKVRATKLVSDVTPASPDIVLTKIDSLNYQINVTPNTPAESNYWFAIYRSEDEDYNRDNDRILNISFKDQTYSYIDNISGTQDFNGNYNYYATTMDRYWNESEMSSVTTSDPIPSLPPIVMSSSIAEGDTIFATNEITIDFSKTIDTLTIAGNVFFAPTISINEFVWANNNKSVTLRLQENLGFETEYTLTLTNAIKDINGISIDGNADGMAGDSFVLTFRTKPFDDTPPQIIYNYPNDDEDKDNFDVQNVITIVFSELLDPELINADNVYITESEMKIEADILMNAVNNQSVINIVPNEEFSPSTEYTIFLSSTIKDTIGNIFGEDFNYSFTTADEHYSEIMMIENFSTPGSWWAPNGSGSTTGINVSRTSWAYSSTAYIPSTPIKKSGRLIYSWDLSVGAHLIREYLAGGSPRDRTFDTNYILQTYLYGDGSNNKFRFAIDEGDGSSWLAHEVSSWIIIDWVGWRLIEWDLSNSDNVGDWLSPDNLLNGSQYRIDSYQLTYDSTGTAEGTVYFDDLRVVKKSSDPVGIDETKNLILPERFTLYQNYPNPFNPITKIRFYMDKPGNASIKIYDIGGREVAFLREDLFHTGFHVVEFNASNYASGVYIYEVSTNGQHLRKKMTLIK